MILDGEFQRLPLSKLEYQFEKQPHNFKIESHGNSKSSDMSYCRTKASTIHQLKEQLEVVSPRIALDKVSEKCGGIRQSESSSSTPRNISQVYNITKSKYKKPQDDVISENDPYIGLILLCKEQAKIPSTAFVRKVEVAPEPAAVLTLNSQIEDILKFCTNPSKFSVLQVDATFNLGLFSVTAMQYEHLLLLNRRSNKPPAMMGPLLIHQKKVKRSYKILTEYLAEVNVKFRGLLAFGTDGEVNLATAVQESCLNAIHLLCFNHMKNNIKEKMKKV